MGAPRGIAAAQRGRADHPGGIRLHRDVAEGPFGRCRRTPGEPEGIRPLHGGIPRHGSLLEHVSLVMEASETEGAEKVSLMTLHAAKGLEFDTVFLPDGRTACSPASGRSTRAGRPAGGGAAPRPCRPDPGAQAREAVLRGEPAHPRPLVVDHPVPVHRRIAGIGRRRGRGPRAFLRRRLAVRPQPTPFGSSYGTPAGSGRRPTRRPRAAAASAPHPADGRAAARARSRAS